MDTSALFLFFTQRIANIAGTHKSFNNALRNAAGVYQWVFI